MASAPGAEQLVKARSEVVRACDLLIAPTPEALQSSQEALRSAVSALTGLGPGTLETPVEPDTIAAARGLRADVLRAGRLWQNLASFYRGWERVLGTMSGGYTASGQPAPVSRSGRLSYRG